jgi:multisubunit Na+/H+ antiporter MnhF subunit
LTAIGHPLAFVGVLVAEVVLVTLLIIRRETLRDRVVVQGQPGGIA